MKRIPGLNRETQLLLSHLRGLVANVEDEDARVVKSFTMGLRYHEPPLDSFRDKEGLYNPVLKNLVSLLVRIVPKHSQTYSNLLNRLLSPLKLDEMCIYMAPQTIVQWMRQEATKNFMMDVLESKSGKDGRVLGFLAENDIMQVLVVDVLEEDEEVFILPNHMYIWMEQLAEANLISADQFEFLADIPHEKILTDERFVNYVQILSLVDPLDFSQQPWGMKLFSLEFHKVLAFDTSPGGVTYFYHLAQAYLSWIGKVPFSWLRPFISDLLEHVLVTYPDRLEYTCTNQYVIESNRILAKLSAGSGQELQFALDFFSRPEVEIFNKNIPSSLSFFRSLCLANLPNKEDFFVTHFSDLDVESASHYATSCVLCLANDEGFCRLLIESGKLRCENLANWTNRDLSGLLKAMSTFDFSAEYMLSELSDTFGRFFFGVDPEGFWEHGKECIRKLLLVRNIDLGPWKSKLSESLAH